MLDRGSALFMANRNSIIQIMMPTSPRARIMIAMFSRWDSRIVRGMEWSPCNVASITRTQVLSQLLACLAY